MSNRVDAPFIGDPPATDLFGVAVPTNAMSPHGDAQPVSDVRPPPAKPQASTFDSAARLETRPSKGTAPQLPRLLTISEVAVRLRICTKTVRRRIQRGELHVHRIGRQLRISEEELGAFLALNRRQPDPAGDWQFR